MKVDFLERKNERHVISQILHTVCHASIEMSPPRIIYEVEIYRNIKGTCRLIILSLVTTGWVGAVKVKAKQEKQLNRPGLVLSTNTST